MSVMIKITTLTDTGSIEVATAIHIPTVPMTGIRTIISQATYLREEGAELQWWVTISAFRFLPNYV